MYFLWLILSSCKKLKKILKQKCKLWKKQDWFSGTVCVVCFFFRSGNIRSLKDEHYTELTQLYYVIHNPSLTCNWYYLVVAGVLSWKCICYFSTSQIFLLFGGCEKAVTLCFNKVKTDRKQDFKPLTLFKPQVMF